MPVLDATLANQILDGILGPNRAAGAEASYIVEGWIDDPRSDGAQQADFDGYDPPTWDSDDWNAADGGQIATSSVVSLGTATGPATDALRFWSLRRVGETDPCYSAPLEFPVWVTTGDVLIRPVVTAPFDT